MGDSILTDITCATCKYVYPMGPVCVAVAACLKCSVTFCETCLAKHEMLIINDKHPVVYIKDMPQRAVYCHMHTDLHRLFCVTCQKHICATCRLLTCYDHQTNPLPVDYD